MNMNIYSSSVLTRVNKSLVLSISILLLSLVMSVNSFANEPDSSKTNGTLSTELEDIKKQVLKLNRDLFILEEDLLFPASTQVAVFVSVDVGRFFKVDSVELKINYKYKYSTSSIY